MSVKTSISEILLRHYYFLLSVLGAIALAELFPWLGSHEGPLYTNFTVKYLAVAVIFFASGLNLQNKQLFIAAQSLRVHIFIQFFSFVFNPILVRLFLFIFVFPFGLDSWIMTGVVAVSCMPPPVSSAVILTKSAKGNEATAIFNSALGNFLGIFLTPLLLLIHVGLSSTVPVKATLFTLVTSVIIPLMMGQLARQFIFRKVIQWRILAEVSNAALIFIIYTSFCDMFIQKEFTINAQHVLVTLFIVVVIQLILIYLSFQVAVTFAGRRRIFSAEDVIAILFCSTQKSLTLGLPLLKTLYSGLSHMSQISLPLLMYHPVQLILGALIVPYAQQWIEKHSRLNRLRTLP